MAKQDAKPAEKPDTEICGKCGAVNQLGRVACRKCGTTFVYCKECKKRLALFDGMLRSKRCNACAALGDGDDPPANDSSYLSEFSDEVSDRRFAFHWLESPLDKLPPKPKEG